MWYVCMARNGENRPLQDGLHTGFHVQKTDLPCARKSKKSKKSMRSEKQKKIRGHLFVRYLAFQKHHTKTGRCLQKKKKFDGTTEPPSCFRSSELPLPFAIFDDKVACFPFFSPPPLTPVQRPNVVHFSPGRGGM